MRSGIILGTAVVLALLLQGCGRKGPLVYPPPQAQKSSPKPLEPQKPAAPSAQQGKKP